MNTQQRIIAALFAVAILLLAVNIIVGKVFKTENQIITPKILSAEEIDSLVFVSIQNFGLELSAIKKQKIKEISIDDNYSTYALSLPKDLPIPVFISELNEIFSDFAVDILTDEKVISGKTLLKIFSEDELRFAANIDYNPNLIREAASVGFLININDKTEKSTIDNLLNTPEPFAFLFTPSLVMKTFVASNQKSSRQFALLLGDETTDLDFKFESNYSERRLKSSIRYVLSAFSQAAFFVIDDNSSFYGSKIYSFVEKEFLARKIKIIKKSELSILSGAITSAPTQFSELVQSLESDQSMLVVCSPEDFDSILNDIRRFRKIGYKYSVPSEILFGL